MKASGSELNRSLVGRYNRQDELFESCHLSHETSHATSCAARLRPYKFIISDAVQAYTHTWKE